MLYSLRAWYNIAMKKTPTLAERIRLTVVLVTLAVFIATALGAMYYRFKNGRSVYYDFKVCQFEKMNDEEEKNGIVFLGDSITDFCDLERWYPGLNAYNRGIAGDMTLGVMRRMDSSVFDLEPRLVVILIGINDLSRHQSVGDTAANIASIISEIRSALPETYIIVQSVYPVNSDWGTAYAERVSPPVTEMTALISAGAEAGRYA